MRIHRLHDDVHGGDDHVHGHGSHRYSFHHAHGRDDVRVHRDHGGAHGRDDVRVLHGHDGVRAHRGHDHGSHRCSPRHARDDVPASDDGHDHGHADGEVPLLTSAFPENPHVPSSPES